MHEPPSWQQIPWHQRLSYWELGEGGQRNLRQALEAEASDCARRAEAALDDYSALPTTLGGQLVNADMLATLLPSLRQNPTQGYEALEDPEGRASVHLNALSKKLRDRALALCGQEPVLVFMGGQATGKTTGALAMGEAFGAVFDAPHTDPDGIAFLLGRIRRAQCEIHLAYTDRTPEGALKAMLSRSEREGRYVPLPRMARAHAWAPFTFLGLAPQAGPALRLYHVRVDEEGSERMTEDQDALSGVFARPKPPESGVAYRLQNAYLSHLRIQKHDTQAWYPRDVLAGLNRSLDAWRRGEADYLLQRFFRVVAEQGAPGGRGPRGTAAGDPAEPGPGLV